MWSNKTGQKKIEARPENKLNKGAIKKVNWHPFDAIELKQRSRKLYWTRHGDRTLEKQLFYIYSDKHNKTHQLFLNKNKNNSKTYRINI